MLVHQVWRHHNKHFVTAFFLRILNFQLFIEKLKLFWSKFRILISFSCSWPRFGHFWHFSKVLEKEKNRRCGSKMAAVWKPDPIVTSYDVASFKGNLFGRTICPPSFVVIALLFLDLKRWGPNESPPPSSSSGPRKPKQKARFEKGHLGDAGSAKFNCHQTFDLTSLKGAFVVRCE